MFTGKKKVKYIFVFRDPQRKEVVFGYGIGYTQGEAQGKFERMLSNGMGFNVSNESISLHDSTTDFEDSGQEAGYYGVYV